MEENKFTEVMSVRTDAELIKILIEHRNDYQPEAIEAAEIEFKKRNLSESEINLAKEENKVKKQIDEERANKKLDTVWKGLTFIFPGILQLLIAGTFRADGFDRKAKELSKWTLYGFGFYFGLVILIMILNSL
jgi:hypothetical protein